MTSNANEACGIIRAHRVILSTCSHVRRRELTHQVVVILTILNFQYFSTLFEACPGQPMICVVLPPEVTKKVLDILVQYMYCGEATVHNDVLNEVLKGGELLKIRGLWRQDSSDYLDHHVYPGHYPASHHPPPSHHHSTVRDRPMIIRNPDERPRTPPPPRDPPMIVSASSSYYPSTSVYVKKDLDAEAASCATCRVTLHSNEAPPLPLPPIPGTSTATDAPLRPPLAENHNFINSTFRRSSTTTMTTTGKCANAKSSSSSATSTFYPTKPNTEERRDFPRQIIHMNKSMQNENPFAESHLPPLPPPPPDEVLRRDSVTSGGSMPPIKIKQEPRDWPEEFDQKPQVDGVTTVVKQELVYNEETEGGSNSGNEDLPMYTPLTCELCKETFTVPGDWVRHIENHAETPQTVPKKRRRTEVSWG